MALAGCQASVRAIETVPDPVLLDRIEQQLAQDQCVGSLDKWQRSYAWRLNWWGSRGLVGSKWLGADKSVVMFDLKQAGVFGFKAGRRVRSPDQRLFEYDSRDYLFAHGRHDVRTGEVVIEYCGPNLS
ncbi:MAG TPA: hypothetical protein PLQ03_06870 [Brevundimonas sp.]|uniref:hypothetical protein n=1 Tax=Brevundimonas sp. TaxID=1871086 RepID=UPI0026206918|nr:hypothetical protein [Brevundimonas sp.]HRO33120.1 hypothetical protein [Brevundimonas sp.]